MTTSRETIRDALVTLLESTLVGDGLPVKTVVGSKVSVLSGLTPLVSVLSAGTGRKRLRKGFPSFYLYILVWVEQAYPGWTNAQALDHLDTIEALISGAFTVNVGGANPWSLVEYSDRSTVIEVKDDGGVVYYVEEIPIVVSTTKA